MPNKNILKHHEALKRRKMQNFLPRYKRRDQEKYVFAARLKKAPYWLVVSEDWWGMVGEELFWSDYIESNDEARSLAANQSAT